MVGNAAEWTASVYEPYPELEAVLPEEFGGAAPSSTLTRPKVEKLQPQEPPDQAPDQPSDQPSEEPEREEDDEFAEEDPRLGFFEPQELLDDRPRVYRGGSINNYPRFLRCANRQKESPGARWYNVGFRCAMDAEPELEAQTESQSDPEPPEPSPQEP
jgi:formylglycine-generating enzyme required for sulfatase activity